jgi:subtilisin family serine protease
MRSHPYLAGAWVARSGDSTEDTTVVPAEAGHGLFVSGLVRRVAKGATLQIHKLLDDKGVADSWTAAQAIVEIGRSGIDILNLSFVCYTEDDRLDPAIVVVAAAGNHGFLDDGRERMPAWPAALDDVIAVGSAIRTKDGHRRSAFTPQGPWVDALTPGEELQSTFLDGTVSVWDDPDNGERHDETFFGYAAGSGTSFAAAALSGTIASLVKPGRTAREASEDMLRTARNEHESRGGEADEPVFIDRPRD